VTVVAVVWLYSLEAVSSVDGRTYYVSGEELGSPIDNTQTNTRIDAYPN
jgi:hypothetical protein